MATVGVRHIVDDVDEAVTFSTGRLGFEVAFRDDVVSGRGGRQVLVESPAGNPVEPFEPYEPASGRPAGPSR